MGKSCSLMRLLMLFLRSFDLQLTYRSEESILAKIEGVSTSIGQSAVFWQSFCLTCESCSSKVTVNRQKSKRELFDEGCTCCSPATVGELFGCFCRVSSRGTRGKQLARWPSVRVRGLSSPWLSRKTVWHFNYKGKDYLCHRSLMREGIKRKSETIWVDEGMRCSLILMTLGESFELFVASNVPFSFGYFKWKQLDHLFD